MGSQHKAGKVLVWNFYDSKDVATCWTVPKRLY